MTDHHRLCVMQCPSPTEAVWIDAIRRTAAELNWSVHDLAIADDWPCRPFRGSMILFSSGEDGVEELEPTRCIILAETPSAAASVTGASLGVDRYSQISLVRTSSRLALSAQLAARRQDVDVLDARAERLLLPDFGWVERGGGITVSPREISPGPLSIFETLPIATGASAFWEPELFSYPSGSEMEGGSPDIDLTGRARVLVFGPYVCLPEGWWSIEINVAVETFGSMVPLMFEWGAGDYFVSHTACVTKPGEYRITLSRRWGEIEQAQVRIWLTQPLFQGHLTFIGSRVTRSADVERRSMTPEVKEALSADQADPSAQRESSRAIEPEPTGDARQH